MRLIDADALIERLKTKSDKMMENKEPAIAGALLGAIYMISHAPTIKPTAHCPNCKPTPAANPGRKSTT